MADAHAPKSSPEPSGSGRSRGAQTAERLRQAARQAFAEGGWHATRVEDIIRHAGVSHGTFYTHYENKAAILDALVRESQADLDALLSAPWAGDVRANLERIIGGFLDVYARDRVVMRTWLEATNVEPAFSQLYLELRNAFVRRVESNLAAAVAASGRDTGPPPATVASTLVAMVEHFAFCWFVLGEPHDRDDAIAAIVLVWGSTLNALANFEVVRLT